MKKENTAIRLKKIMSDRNIRQVDILNKTTPYCEKYGVKMNKSDISQYCSGKTEPNQDKLFVLGMALNVNEAWLMGYDVPMERNFSVSKERPCGNSYEKLVIKEMKKLNQKGRVKLLDTVREMACNPLYNPDFQMELAAAHERTDIEINEEMRKHDDDIMLDDLEWE